METLTRSLKIWITASLILLFMYNAYIIRGSYQIFFGYLMHEPQATSYVNMTGIVFWAGHLGLTARFIGLLLGLAAVFLLWVKANPFSKVKCIVATALFLEGVNFLGLLPSAWWLMNPDSPVYTPFLGAAYVLQFLLIVPISVVLAFKVKYYGGSSFGYGLEKWAAAAFVGYVAALGVNAVFRWFDMISIKGITFLTGIVAVGFLSAVVLMPLAVIFAVAGAFSLGKSKTASAMKWLGLALVTVGLYYAFYLVYSYFAHSLNSVVLVDVWTVPLLGLGIAMLTSSRKHGGN
jgi:hypothetical protein